MEADEYINVDRVLLDEKSYKNILVNILYKKIYGWKNIAY